MHEIVIRSRREIGRELRDARTDEEIQRAVNRARIMGYRLPHDRPVDHLLVGQVILDTLSETRSGGIA